MSLALALTLTNFVVALLAGLAWLMARAEALAPRARRRARQGDPVSLGPRGRGREAARRLTAEARRRSPPQPVARRVVSTDRARA